jgi:hypothetical protein
VRLRRQPTRAWWEQLFAAAATSSLCDGSWPDRFPCGFEWFVKNDENPRKVLDGNYRRLAPVVTRPLAAKRGAEPMPAMDLESPAAQERQARREAALRARDERAAEAEQAIAQLSVVVKDALMAAADDELASFRETMHQDAYEKALRQAMVQLLVDSSRGRTIADAVAHFTALHMKAEAA